MRYEITGFDVWPTVARAILVQNCSCSLRNVGSSGSQRVDALMNSHALLFLGRNRFGGEVPLHEVHPPGRLFIAPIETCRDGRAHGTAHIVTGDQIVGEWVAARAMIVVTVHILKQVAPCSHRVSSMSKGEALASSRCVVVDFTIYNHL